MWSRVSSFRGLRNKCVKDTLDAILLRSVEEAPKCGYELIAYIHKSFHVLLSPGTVYPLLEKLEKYGFLTSNQQDKKRYYTLTGQGQEFIRELSLEYWRIRSFLENERLPPAPVGETPVLKQPDTPP